MIRFIALLLWCVLPCAVLAGEPYTSQVEFQASGFNGMRLSGQKIRVLPLASKDGRMAGPVWPGVKSRYFEQRRKDLLLQFDTLWEEKALNTISSDELKRFYLQAFSQSVLSLRANPVWKNIPEKYIVLIRVKNWAKIKDHDGVTTRFAEFEAELWDVPAGTVQWRAHTSGKSSDTKTNDADFILTGVTSLVELLPEAPDFREGNEPW